MWLGRYNIILVIIDDQIKTGRRINQNNYFSSNINLLKYYIMLLILSSTPTKYITLLPSESEIE